MAHQGRILKHHYIGTEHNLLGVARENEGVAHSGWPVLASAERWGTTVQALLAKSA